MSCFINPPNPNTHFHFTESKVFQSLIHFTLKDTCGNYAHQIASKYVDIDHEEY